MESCEQTIREYRAAVKAAKRVFCVPMFGNCITPVRISKADALYIVKGVAPDTTAEELETSGLFNWDEGRGDLYIGN